MMVGVVVRLDGRAHVERLVTATRYEPVAVDAVKGTVAFDLPYRRVEAILNRFAECEVGEFEAQFMETDEPA